MENTGRRRLGWVGISGTIQCKHSVRSARPIERTRTNAPSSGGAHAKTPTRDCAIRASYGAAAGTHGVRPGRMRLVGVRMRPLGCWGAAFWGWSSHGPPTGTREVRRALLERHQRSSGGFVGAAARVRGRRWARRRKVSIAIEMSKPRRIDRRRWHRCDVFTLPSLGEALKAANRSRPHRTLHYVPVPAHELVVVGVAGSIHVSH